VTRLIYDRRFTYQVPHGSVTTRARVFRLNTGLDVLIATELLDHEDNPGPSITNTIENLATEAVEAFGLDPGRLAVFEQYDYRDASYKPNGELETYDEASFEWDGEEARRPQWHRRSRASLAVLLALDDFDTITVT
jgi:hypothetical protein